MRGYMLIQDHPYMAVSDKDGKFEIKNLPVGEWTFIVWQEGVGFLPRAQVNGKPQEWRRGRMTVKITDGKTTELGQIIVDPAVLEKK
jgi:hypothetical protein